MTTDRRQEAVEQLSALLERDELTVDDYRVLVDRVLATTSEDEVALVLATVPPPPPVPIDDELVIACNGGVVKETPGRLAPSTEIRCESGVVKVDLRSARIDTDEVDLDIVITRGVVKVMLPRRAAVELAEHQAGGGVFKNRTQPVSDPDAPRIRLRVRNDGGVVKVVQRRWGR